MTFRINKSENQNISKWSGGISRQLYIFPEDSGLENRNFDLRISTATVEMEESEFSIFKGYKRKLMVLEGFLEICHQFKDVITLNAFEQHFFSGDWITKSKGKVTDFNLIYRPEIETNLYTIKLKAGEEYLLVSIHATFIYLFKGVCLSNKLILNEGESAEALNQGNIILKAKENSILIITEWKKGI